MGIRLVSLLSVAELLRMQYDNEFYGLTELVNLNSVNP